MKNRGTVNILRQGAMATIIMIMMLAPIAMAAEDIVLPANQLNYGKTYGNWSGEFWKWLYSMPENKHPLFDTADCGEGQSGDVWFLGGTFATTEESPGTIVGNTTRNCTLPAGKALFFPIVNYEASIVEGNGQNEAELRENATFIADHIVNKDLKATVDGISIPNLKHYRVESPLFKFGPLPANNVLQRSGFPNAIPGTTSPSVSDGVHLMLAPLSAGQHTIHWEGTIDLSNTFYGIKFKQDITYNINVES